MTKKRKTELISGYKHYAEDIIKSRGCSLDNYKLVQADVENLRNHVTAGDGYPCADGSAVTFWQRIPSLDFDKDTRVYFYCSSNVLPSGNYRYVIINAITNEEKPSLIIVRYDYTGE